VDDNPTSRDLLQELRADVGIVVAGAAASGEEALEQVDDLRPDLVIMDWAMPGMDGIEATARIRHDHPATRVIGWTSHDEPGLHDAFLSAGATAVYQKGQVMPLLRYLRGSDSAA
jgi:CheY-like chemotaxis protein